jgi:hypothetical protein
MRFHLWKHLRALPFWHKNLGLSSASYTRKMFLHVFLSLNTSSLHCFHNKFLVGNIFFTFKKSIKTYSKKMGVYIFRSKRGPYIKVGHYAGQNAYSRVAHRGFYSCVCPYDIQTCVSIDDLDLIGWFPNLTTKEERGVKRQWKSVRIGEWFPISHLEEIYQFLSNYDTDQSKYCNRESACQTRRRL